MRNVAGIVGGFGVVDALVSGGGKGDFEQQAARVVRPVDVVLIFGRVVEER